MLVAAPSMPWHVGGSSPRASLFATPKAINLHKHRPGTLKTRPDPQERGTGRESAHRSGAVAAGIVRGLTSDSPPSTTKIAPVTQSPPGEQR